MMSSLPSLSQSISPTPPLIDSTMYFLSGEEMCATVRPACWAISSNFGRDAVELGGSVLCAELAGDFCAATCASAIGFRSSPMNRENVHTEGAARIGRAIIQARANG